MARFVTISVLVAPILAARVQVGVQSVTQSFEHLSSADSLEANAALDILAQLKENSNDVLLQEKYRAAIGEIEWEEDRTLLLTGMNYDTPPPMLGAASEPGRTRLKLVELLSGRLGKMSWFTTRVGRFFTGRRDFAIEETDGDTKYTIDGITRSLHSRMQVSFPNDPFPKFVVRRAFNYLNPVASTVGQYVYRVIRCTEEQGGWAGGCKEGEMLYTITKDRFGRGAMWAQDEYRVYTGTGGCRRHGYGVLSCHREHQIMYSISNGLSSGNFDTTFYNGHISEINGDHESGRLYDGTMLSAGDLSGMQVATVSKIHGSPRPLNWPAHVASAASGATFGAMVHGGNQRNINVGQYWDVADAISNLEDTSEATINAWLDYSDSVAFGEIRQAEDAQGALQPALRLITDTDAWVAAEDRLQGLADATQHLAAGAVVLAWSMHIARALIWADSYVVAFNGGGGSTDDLLVSIVAAVQDLTREGGTGPR